ncbi:MAG: hypothetical protein WA414_13780 [Acidobacteriaceae bacterium]
MKKWRIPAACAVALSLAFASLALAEQRKVHEYKLHEPTDQGAPFALLIGPDHAAYTLVPRRDGNWILSQVQQWWQEKPVEVGILVEGFSNHDSVSAPGQMDLAITPDGKFLVTILSAGIRVPTGDPYPMDMIVEVVRLDTFEVVNTEHMRSLGLRGMMTGFLDHDGQLVVRSAVAPDDPAQGTAPYITWFRMSVPELKPELMCSFQSSAPANPQDVENACGSFAKREGAVSAQAFDQAWQHPAAPPAPVAPDGVAFSPKDRFQSTTVTIDGKPLTLVVVNGIDLQVYAEK